MTKARLAMRDKQLVVCALNLNADPHPEGIYVSALRLASKQAIRARGDDFLKVTPPRKIRDVAAYEGRILLWTEIDVKGRWLDVESEDELEDKSNINIPSNAKPNYRTFNYVFSETNHRLYFESTNEFGDRLGATTAKRAFSFLLAQRDIAELANISVSIEPDIAAVDRILATPGLQTIELRINRPNGDTVSRATTRRVLAKLEAVGATRYDEVWAARGKGNDLKITQELSDRAHVAADTGFFRASARTVTGGRISLSSDAIPRRYLITLAGGETLFQRLRSKIRNIT